MWSHQTQCCVFRVQRREWGVKGQGEKGDGDGHGDDGEIEMVVMLVRLT